MHPRVSLAAIGGVVLVAILVVGGMHRVWSVYRPSVEPVPQSLVEELHKVAAHHALANLDQQVGTIQATGLAPAETKHDGADAYLVAGTVDVNIDGEPMVVRYSGLVTWKGSKEASDITNGFVELRGLEATDRDQSAKAE